MAINDVLSPSERMAKKRALNGLPEDVQQEIERISDSLEELVRRCGIAWGYQVQHPNSIHKGVPYGMSLS